MRALIEYKYDTSHGDFMTLRCFFIYSEDRKTNQKKMEGFQMNHVINVSQLEKKFGKHHALKGIDFKLEPGEVFGLLGPSGSGKTTTIRILIGELKKSGGSIEVLGFGSKEFTKNEYLTQIGILSDRSALYDRLTVQDNLQLFRRLYQVEESVIDRVLKDVGLYNDRKKKVKDLSKGMKQRVLLCKAIMHKPKVMFLDEPTSALDPATTSKIHEILEELKAQGTTILLTTHDMEEATKLCDNVALLDDGVFKEYGTPESLRLKYKEDTMHVMYKDGKEETIKRNVENKERLADLMVDENVLKISSDYPSLGEVFIKVTGRELV